VLKLATGDHRAAVVNHEPRGAQLSCFAGGEGDRDGEVRMELRAGERRPRRYVSMVAATGRIGCRRLAAGRLPRGKLARRRASRSRRSSLFPIASPRRAASPRMPTMLARPSPETRLPAVRSCSGCAVMLRRGVRGRRL
jgi:hypothetical protein